VRIIPVSEEQTRTVCLRLELYGCANREHIGSYSAQEGDFTSGFDGRDSNYDGDLDSSTRVLTHGLGRLFDGVKGGESGEGWVAWRRISATAEYVPLELHLSAPQEVSSLSMYVVDGKWNASVPQRVVLKFPDSSLPPLKFNEPLSPVDKHIEEFEPGDGSETGAHWIRIGFRARRVSTIHAELLFRDAAEWLMISEVTIGLGPQQKSSEELPANSGAQCWALLLLACPILITATLVSCLVCTLCRRMHVDGGGGKFVDMSPSSKRTLQLVLKSSGVKSELANGGLAMLQQEEGYAEPYGVGDEW
jgi:hypothetical protein